MPRLLRFLAIAVGVASLPAAAGAGGPLNVAGVTFFQSGLAGTPITWAGGQVSYYTDQGDLSPILTQPDADALVADAFLRWTTISTAALSATRAGSLDEDVNATNVTRAGGVITIPADIRPESSKPLAIVYDQDGSVTDALLGGGASDPALCAANSVIGGADRFGSDAHIAHALVVLNGRCAQSPSDLQAFRYRLVRMLGRVLGLDWSQLNDNVAAGAAAAEDYAGFPLMHPLGSLCGSTGCIAGADQPRMDDRAAISRLYPITTANVASFPGKKLFAENTARIRGVVRFAGGGGMQGVNVVGRLLDANGQVSRSIAASSVSGFLFRGNAGNPVTGFTTALGDRWDRFGSDDPTLEGYYDLGGLEIPAGSNTAQYELRAEPVRPEYVGSAAVGPYRSAQVAVSGSAQSMVVTVTRGGDVIQDIVLRNSAEQTAQTSAPSFATPAKVPGGGVWAGALGAYGETEFYSFSGRADRVGSFEVQAVDEAGLPSKQKLLPVIGIWPDSASEGAAPAATATYFNTSLTGLTQLQAQFDLSRGFKLGIADYRGDGRPDFRYRARVFYADTLEPARATTAGGTVLTITGTGFVPAMSAMVGGVAAPVLSFTPEQIKIAAPPMADGVANIELRDPATGARAIMVNALRYGATPQDVIALVSGANPQVPVGTEAPVPVRVRVSAPDGQAVAGATVRFTSAGASVNLLPCASATCNLATNGEGEAAVTVLVKAAGAASITASLANGASVTETVSGISSTSPQIAAMPPKMWMARNTSATVPLRVRVVQSGSALTGRSVSFQRVLGQGTLSASSATTDAMGDATVRLTVTSIASETRVAACVMPANAPCAVFFVFPVSDAGLVLRKIAGDDQYANPGQTFAPVTVRVLDSSSPANAVAGMPVTFRVTAFRAQDAAQAPPTGEVVSGPRVAPVALSSTEALVFSDSQGMASIAPSFPAQWGALVVFVQASAGGASQGFKLHTWATAQPPLPWSTGSIPVRVTSADTNRPSGSRSCTRAGCSAASGPSGPRRGSKASWRAPSAAAK